MEFQLSYFKSWKMTLWKCCTQYASKCGKLSSGHRTGKGQFSSQSQRKAMPKNAQTTISLISHASKVMLKIFQARLQKYVNHELPDVQSGFRKGRGARDQIANIHKCSGLVHWDPPRGIWWGGRQEGGLGWGTHVNPWLIHVNVWQNPLQYCKVISLQLIKINEK